MLVITTAKTNNITTAINNTVIIIVLLGKVSKQFFFQHISLTRQLNVFNTSKDTSCVRLVVLRILVRIAKLC